MTEANKILPIASVENNCILSANGDITLAYEIHLPEIFTLAEREYDAFHQAWIKAIKLLPEHTVLHKQDWFVKRTVRESSGKTFLSTSSDRFYSGRPYMAHNCYLFLTKKPDDRKPSNSAFCNILRKSIVPKQTVDSVLLRNFEDIAGQFTRVLEDSDFVGLRRLTDDELAGTANKAGITERYCFLLDEGEESHLCDTHIGERMTIGNKHCEMYTLSDVEQLPSMCGSRINYDRYSTDRTKFSIGFASTLGLLLDCDHLYNQYLFIGDSQKTIKELERKR